MQHDGHSRVVVGISVRGLGSGSAAETQLLIMDPLTYGPDLRESLGSGTGGWHAMVKRGLHTLKKPEYQFLVINPNAAVGAHTSRNPSSADEEHVV